MIQRRNVSWLVYLEMTWFRSANELEHVAEGGLRQQILRKGWCGVWLINLVINLLTWVIIELLMSNSVIWEMTFSQINSRFSSQDPEQFWTPLSLHPLLMAGGELSAPRVQFSQKPFLHPRRHFADSWVAARGIGHHRRGRLDRSPSPGSRLQLAQSGALIRHWPGREPSTLRRHRFMWT